MWQKGRGVSNVKTATGEDNPAAVLTDREAELVRKLVLANVPQILVAEVFGVSVTTVSDIVRGRRRCC